MGSSLKIKLQTAIQTKASGGKGVQYVNESDYLTAPSEMNLYRNLSQAFLPFWIATAPLIVVVHMMRLKILANILHLAHIGPICISAICCDFTEDNVSFILQL